ncbi:hypothetical protein [Celeribacter neptunius]|uniref:Uncharacterized protein n=1 Tax=Celeribacter neptunius TaxID=588602 RepID=A0A1I3JVV4_9RHOB|nr:hypothetical protein [Celeribacter neptunius]SFI64314.1 hypothetical protein SAMN04487991_0482 [Celeribacter neptunius]
MFGFSKSYHPLDSRHPDNRRVARSVTRQRETFRTAEKSQYLRHFFLPPNARRTRARIAALKAKPHISESQKHELRYLEGRFTGQERARIERETIKRVPLPLRLLLGSKLRIFAMLRGQWSTRGRREQDQMNVFHLLLIAGALGLMISSAGGIAPAWDALREDFIATALELRHLIRI